MKNRLLVLVRYSFLLIIAAEFAFVRWHVVDIRTVAAIEGVLTLVGLVQVGRALWRMRHAKLHGATIWQALEDGLAILLPRSVARLVALEPRIWLCLLLWPGYRRKPHPNAFGYDKDSSVGLLVIAVLFTLPVEVLLGEVLIPWPWLKLSFVILGIYTAFWMLAYAAALTVLPHRLSDEGLHIQYGFLAEGIIPYEAIAELRMEKRQVPGQRDGLNVVATEATAYLVVGGTTTITIALHAPIPLQGLLRPTLPVSTICIFADDAPGLVAALVGVTY